MVIETGTETAVFFAKPNRTETAVLCLCIDGSVLKWSSSGVLAAAYKSSHPLLSPAGVIVGSKVRSPAAAALHPACEDRRRLATN